MGRHQADRIEGPNHRARFGRGIWIAAGLAVLAGGLVAGVVATVADTPPPRARSASGTPANLAAGSCPHELTVVSAGSFVPILSGIAARLGAGRDCVAVHVQTADGQGAAAAVASSGADVWIPDDVSWPNLPNPAKLAAPKTFHAGTVLATSPFYFVTQHGAPPLPAKSWLGLIRALAQPGSPWHLALRDPAATGDGMVAAGALTDVEIGADGVLVAALNLLRAEQTGTLTATGFPNGPNQVAVVPEYTLLRTARASDYTVVAPTDGTAVLNFTWLPSAAAVSDPNKGEALDRLYQALTSGRAADDLAASGLRGPAWFTAPPDAHLPAASRTAIAAVSEHVMYHVLATWHPDLRRSNMLIVLDVSGSMARPGPGTTTPKIALVRQGIDQVARLLPDSAQLGLWQFGSQLAPPNDWQSLVPPAPLEGDQRAAVAAAAAHLRARHTGTGLYDTILGAYRYQQAHFQADMPNEVVVFTDGINQDDPGTISLDQLHAGLAGTDPHKRVQVSIFGIGSALPTDALTQALTPVGELATAEQVIGGFVHAVSGALSGIPG
jgi:hypothetical protein